MPRSHPANWVALVVVLLVFGQILNRQFGPVLRHPTEYLFNPYSDGLKNYYTLAYYLRYDAGTRFTGMNYPFGEHVVFTDNQPLVAFLGQAGQYLGLPVAAHAVGLVNVLLLLSQFLTLILLYLIGRRALLPGWFAAGLALLLLLLSPQQQRLLGHYALAYSFVFPATWYCLLRAMSATEPRPVRWTGVYVLVTTLSGLLHPYHLMLGTLFAAASVGAWALRSRSQPLQGKTASPLRQAGPRLLLAVVLPLLLFQGWMMLTDTVTDRPANPYGFLVANATWQGVFLPGTGPLRTFFQAIFHFQEVGGEGPTYVGLVVTLVALLTAVRLLGRLVRGRWRQAWWLAAPEALQASTWAAVLVLLFACAYPFRWGLEGLVQYLGPLRQFRALGRFAWVFYYVFGIYAGFYLHLLYRYLRQRRAVPVAYGVLAVAAAVWGAEGWLYFSERASQAQASMEGHTLLNPARPFTEQLALGSRAPTDFQAILPLPYYNEGSEKISIQRGNESPAQSMRASLELHLPLATDRLSRTSITQTLALAQLLSNPLLPKPVLRQLPSDKPLLIVNTHEKLEPAEQLLLSRARLLYDSPTLALYELPLAALASVGPAAAARFAARRDSLRPGSGGLLLAGPSDAVQRLDFAGQSGIDVISGASSGGLHGQGLREILRVALPATDTAGYEISVWCWARARAALPALSVQQAAPDGSLLLLGGALGTECTDVAGDWLRLSAVVHPRAGEPVRISLEGDDYVADELLVRPRATAVYQLLPDGRLRFNNFPLPAPQLAANR